jgi:hypothetical protein
MGRSSNFWMTGLDLGLWYSTPLSTIFQVYRGGQFDLWRKPNIRRKPPTKVHNAELSTPRHGWHSNSQRIFEWSIVE